MRDLRQQHHSDLGLLDDDLTEDLRPNSETAPANPGARNTGRGPLRTTQPIRKEVHRDHTR
jgi:hypothetical protein